MDFTPQQQAAISGRARRICVDAGAGSGKTRVLIERMVHLVDLGGVPLEQIAAITFTDKAAAEMKARLRAAFRQRAREAVENPERTNFWRGLEQRVDTARISTIHSFCAGFLREYSLYIGVDPDFGVLGDAEAALMLTDTVRAAVVELLEAQNGHAQHLAAELGVGPLRDTLEVLLRQAPLAEQAFAAYPHGDPDALYAAWQAALDGELKRRTTVEAVAPHIEALQRFAGACGVESDGREQLRKTMLAALAALPKVKHAKDLRARLDVFLAKGVRGQKKHWESEAQYEALKACQDKLRKWAEELIALAPDPEIDLPAARSACALAAVYAHTAAAWADAKRAVNALDFDAIIRETLRVLRENAHVRASAAGALRHLLIDEFQDTDRVQMQIAEHLCGEPGGPALFFVGDPKQSIYNFRGAEVELFGLEREKAETRVFLHENFRTVPPIIAFINRFFGQTRLLRAVGDYAAMGHGRPAPETAPGGPRIEFLEVPVEAGGEKRNAEELRREEARWIAGRIAALCAPAAAPLVQDEATGAWRVPRFSDFALLFRGTGALYLYEEALRAAGIDFIAAAGAGFYRRQEVLDVVNCLRVVVGPGDTAALAAFLRGPLCGLSDDALVLLTARAPRKLAEVFQMQEPAAELEPQDAAAWARARALIADLRAHRYLPPAGLLERLYALSGIESVALDHHYGLQKAANLRKLLALAHDFMPHTRPPLDRFVRYLADVAGHEALREGEALMQPFGGGAVTLMTIHKSKGLQFPIVFVCDMTQAPGGDRDKPLFLHRELGAVLRVSTPLGETARPALARAINARNAVKDEAESARLLYVAMTRARDYLILCGRDKARTGTWFRALAEFAALDHATEGVARGEDWQARVIRETPPAVAMSRVEHTPVELPEAMLRLEREQAELSARAAAGGVQSISVSALLDRMTKIVDDEDGPELERVGEHLPGASGALRRGSVVHRLFELWNFGAPPPIEAALEGAPAGIFERRRLAADLLAIAERVQGLPVFGELRAAEFLREMPFSLALGNAIVHGTIDALAPGALLLDYKTGRIDPAKQGRYTLQLQFYAAALRALGQPVPARACLLYTDVPCAEMVPIAAADLDRAIALARDALAEHG